MSEFKIPICPPPEVRSAIKRYAAKRDITDMYAIHQCILKTLRSEGELEQEVYDYYMPRFSKTITSMSERPVKVSSPEQQKVNQKLCEMGRTFAMVSEQWDLEHKPGWKDQWLRQAEKYKDSVPEAKLLLDKVADRVFIK